MTTKEQERQAIEEIRKIVEGLGENSYVGFAMEGVLELAEDNIREDTAYSMKKNAEIAWERADKAEKESKLLNAELGTAKKITEENNKVIAKLKADIYKLKANEVPEELIEEMYNMAYDKEAEMIEKMEETADQMADASIAGEDVQKFAEDYKAQKEKRNRYAKMMDTLDARERGGCKRENEKEILSCGNTGNHEKDCCRWSDKKRMGWLCVHMRKAGRCSEVRGNQRTR